MGISLTITDSSTGMDTTVPVCGFNELHEVWLPACDKLDLEILPVCLQGGMTITKEYYDRLVGEVSRVVTAFTTTYPCEDNVTNICFRASRLLKLLKDNPITATKELYLG
jgi:hypothetical protein